MNDLKFYDKRTPICDGAVILYLPRNLQKPRWTARFKIKGQRGYVVRSMKTHNFEEAKVKAQKLYQEMTWRVSTGLPIDKPTWNEAFDRFMQYPHAKTLSDDRKTLLNLWQRLYWSKFFGPLRIEALDDKRMFKYHAFRKQYWHQQLEEHGSIPATARLNPKAHTLEAERRSLNQILLWCYKIGYINKYRPLFRASGIRETLRTEPNETFTSQEWRKLRGHLQAWIKETKRAPDVEYAHVQLYCFIYIQANTGMRTSELLSIRWEDVSEYKLRNGMEVLKIKLKKGKTGGRDIICNPGTEKWFRQLLELHTKTNDGNKPGLDWHCWRPYVWKYTKLDKDGADPEHSRRYYNGYSNMFRMLLKRWGLWESGDRWGSTRTLTSIRQFYIYQKILNRVPPIAVAQQCGNSVEQIQKYYLNVRKELFGVQVVDYMDDQAFTGLIDQNHKEKEFPQFDHVHDIDEKGENGWLWLRKVEPEETNE
jgi:integrase